MARDAPAKPALAGPQEALWQYLQGLLNEVTLTEGADTALGAELPASMPTPAPAVTAAVLKPAEPAPPVLAEPPGPRVPEWGRQSFQCLEFAAGGMRLGLPLERLRGIAPWTGELTRLPGMPPWQLGLLKFRGHQVGVLDLGRLLQPKRSAASPNRGHVLLLSGMDWGLACEHLAAPLWVAPSAIRWRRVPGRPPCIAGVLVERLLPILDTEEVLARIADGRSPPG